VGGSQIEWRRGGKKQQAERNQLALSKELLPWEGPLSEGTHDPEKHVRQEGDPKKSLRPMTADAGEESGPTVVSERIVGIAWGKEQSGAEFKRGKERRRNPEKWPND